MKIKLIGICLCVILGIAACGTGSSNASRSPEPVFAYIGDSSNNLWLCPTTNSGSFGANCTPLINTTSPGFNQSHGAIVQTFNGQAYAYVVDVSSNLWQCTLNSTGGFSNGCTALTNSTAPGFNTTIDITFATFNGIVYAYISDASHTLWQCPINTMTGGFNGSCNALTNQGTTPFTNTRTVAFGTFKGTTYGYISDTSQNIWQCPMTLNGQFNGPCNAISGFVNTRAATLATFASITYLYVSNFNDSLLQCQIESTTGSFNGASSCNSLTTSNPAFFQTRYATFQNFGGTTYAYVGDQQNYALQCPINQSTGGFSDNCTPQTNITAPGFVNVVTTTFYTP